MLSDVMGVTLCQPQTKSKEFVVHVKNDYDYRFQALKNTRIKFVNIVTDLINAQVKAGQRSEQLEIYLVDRSNLKIYATTKGESKIGKYRRPQP